MVPFPPEEKMLFSPKGPDRLWGPPSLLLNGHWGSLLGVKRSEREVDHTSPPSAEVKNEWRYTSTPPIRLDGKMRT